MLTCSTRVFLGEKRPFLLRLIGDATGYEQYFDGGIVHTSSASLKAARRSTQFGQAPHGNWADA